MMASATAAEKLQKISQQYHLSAVYAFGSRAREALMLVQGEGGFLESSDSDLDVGVLPDIDHPLSVQQVIQLAQDLEALFGVERVDLVLLPDAPPFLALEIIRGELLTASDPVQEAEYQLYVLRRAGDLAPWERERRRMLREGEAL